MEIFTLFFGYFVCGFLVYMIYQYNIDEDLYDLSYCFNRYKIIRIIIRLLIIIFWPIFLILLIYYIIGLLLFELFIDITK